MESLVHFAFVAFIFNVIVVCSREGDHTLIKSGDQICEISDRNFGMQTLGLPHPGARDYSLASMERFHT